MIRNILFLIFFYIGIISICIFYLPTFLLPHKITLTGGKLMGHWSKFCLNLFLSTNVVIKGKENIINNEKFFIVCSHQSMFETFFLQTIFNSPVFILKKELKIKCQPVAINSGLVWPKNGPLKANKKLTVSILEPINPNLDEKNFLELVQKRIYEELDNLN